MPNKLRNHGHGLGLQVTREARSAGLVEENADGEPTRLADVRVYGFDELLLVVDLESLDVDEIAVLVAEAAWETKSIHQSIDAKLHGSGNGYLVHLPGVEDAGLRKGEEVVCQPAPGLLVIHRDSPGVAERGDDLVRRRKQQV